MVKCFSCYQQIENTEEPPFLKTYVFSIDIEGFNVWSWNEQEAVFVFRKSYSNNVGR